MSLAMFNSRITSQILIVRDRLIYFVRGCSFLSRPVPEFSNQPNIQSYEDLYKFSVSNPSKFWGTLARSRIAWRSDFVNVVSSDFKKGLFRWFENGKLNICDSCIDRHVNSKPDSTALIWEQDEPGHQTSTTYRELSDLVNRIANMFTAHGVKRGDIIAIYMPVCPHLVATMLACAKLGAIHNVVFAGFSSDALATRIQDAHVKVVVTADQALRGGKTIDLKRTVDQALKSCPAVQKVFVYQRTGADIQLAANNILMDQELAQFSTECSSEVMDSEDTLFMLYTSGSTGKPKGIAHTQAGYLLYTTFTFQQVFDYRPGDIFGCVADIGWITGHSYVVYGPLSNGATSILFESTPTYPDPGRYWEMVERLKLTQIYLAPTALRLLLKHGDSYVKAYDRSSLRVLGCVGEPLNREAWEWYNNVIGEGRCDLVDTWWQTETGGIMITPRPSGPKDEIIPAKPMRPFYGVDLALLDRESNELQGNDVRGGLCVKQAWPGMARTLYGNHERFLDTYFNQHPGYYFAGDAAYRDSSGYYQIKGRVDDVINVSGHRLGTAEVEDVLDEHDDIAESAVVGCPHDVKGEVVYAFITLKDHVSKPTDDVIKEVNALVAERIAKFAVPHVTQVTNALPKTRSGKIMRRILRKIVTNSVHELGDITTLAEPEVVQILIEEHERLMKK